jgi:hypothetical protein
MATEGRATRQRPRLLLGRSVFSPHFNVALPIFQFSARSEIFVFSVIFFFTTYNYSLSTAAPVSPTSPKRFLLPLIPTAQWFLLFFRLQSQLQTASLFLCCSRKVC